MPVTHAFVSAIADGGDATLVRPSDWNDDHVVVLRTITISSGSFTAGADAGTDYVYLLNGAHVPTMPTAVGNINKYTFKSQHTERIGVLTTSSQTIDGHASGNFYIYLGEEVIFYSNGTNWVTSVRGARRVCPKITSNVYTSNSTQTDDPDFQIDMLPNLEYDIHVKLVGNTNDVTANVKYSLLGPTSPTTIRCVTRTWAGATLAETATNALPSSATLAVSNSFFIIDLEVTFRNGANAGTFKVQHSQQTSDADAIQITSGSVMDWVEN